MKVALVSMALALGMSLSLTACGGVAEDVGVEEGAGSNVPVDEQSFKDEGVEAGGGSNVSVDEQSPKDERVVSAQGCGYWHRCEDFSECGGYGRAYRYYCCDSGFGVLCGERQATNICC
jgi:hypothetical protein